MREMRRKDYTMEKTRLERINEFIRIMGEALGPNTAITLAGELERMGFFDAPASSKYHSAYPGGLYDHSKAMMDALLNLTYDLNLGWSRPESPCIVGMLHDLCKCDQYKQDEDGSFSFAGRADICAASRRAAVTVPLKRQSALLFIVKIPPR